MSLYNMAVGYDRAATVVLTAVGMVSGMEKEDFFNSIPRFRDAYIDVDNGDHDPVMVILTRTGGNNRSEYESENENMKRIPGYIDDRDDDFDGTFAHFRYRPHDDIKDVIIHAVSRFRAEGYTFPKPMDRFKQVVEDAKQGNMPGQLDSLSRRIIEEVTNNPGGTAMVLDGDHPFAKGK